MKPLDDLFVVDLSRILSGPVCTMLLADMGARVIKIEPPPSGDDSRQWGPPAKLGASLADVVAGLYATNGILLALLARHKTGTGQHVDVSLLDGMVSTLTYQALIYLSTGRSPQRLGTRHPSIVPYECFQAKDGFVNIAVTNQKQWENFCQVLGFPELATDSRFETMQARLAHYGELRPMIDHVVSKLSRAETIACMSAAGIPAGPINTVGEIMDRSEEHTSELQSRQYLVCRLLLEKKKNKEGKLQNV